jgi:hypothetical protein
MIRNPQGRSYPQCAFILHAPSVLDRRSPIFLVLFFLLGFNCVPRSKVDPRFESSLDFMKLIQLLSFLAMRVWRCAFQDLNPLVLS